MCRDQGEDEDTGKGAGEDDGKEEVDSEQDKDKAKWKGLTKVEKSLEAGQAIRKALSSHYLFDDCDEADDRSRCCTMSWKW